MRERIYFRPAYLKPGQEDGLIEFHCFDLVESRTRPGWVCVMSARAAVELWRDNQGFPHDGNITAGPYPTREQAVAYIAAHWGEIVPAPGTVDPLAGAAPPEQPTDDMPPAFTPSEVAEIMESVVKQGDPMLVDFDDFVYDLRPCDQCGETVGPNDDGQRTEVTTLCGKCRDKITAANVAASRGK